MRLTETRKGKNVIPLRYAIYGKDIPFWSIERRNQTEKFLYGDAADKLAAYEDTGLTPEEVESVHKGLYDFYELEAKGRLVVFPLGIGDTFYNIERFCDGSTGDCDSLVPCDRCPDYEPEIIERKIRTITQAAHVMEALNKTAFLTREAAEAALKGENT